VCSNSEFKYPIYNTDQEYGRIGCFGHFNRSFGDCDCSIGPDYIGFTFANGLSFFRGIRLEHYYQLRENVFVWLDRLHFQYLQNENRRYILENIYVEMGKDSMFYDDARRHMSRRMRENIDNFEKSLKDYNVYVNSSNPTINDGINGIISKPVYGKLTSDQISSIYSTVQIAFSQAIKGADEVETSIKKWNMASKLSTHGFNTQPEMDNGKNILAAIQQDESIINTTKELKSRINNLIKQQDIIKSQSKEISDEIQHNRYKGVRRCCPTLIKELWHTMW
jgi:hypothetical protein